MPSVAVLVWDAQSRLLLVRDAGGRRRTTVGGAIELDIVVLRGVFAGPRSSPTPTPTQVLVRAAAVGFAAPAA